MKYFLTDVKKLYRNKLFLLALAILFVAAVIDPITMRSSFEQQGNPFMWWMFMSRTTGSTIYNTLEWFFPVLLTGLLFVDESKTAIYGILIIVTSHHKDDIEAICDNVMFMRDGKLKSA